MNPKDSSACCLDNIPKWDDIQSAQSLVSPLRAMRILIFIICLSGALIIGCAHRHEGAAVVRADSLESSVGQRVTLIGVAEPRKSGAALRGDDFYVWIDGLHDLPVFVQKPDELPVQGMPVPEGTDLHAASRRYVVRDATWSLLQ